MNIQEKKELKAIISELKSLAYKAELRSNTIIDEGNLIEDTCRAKSEGYASAYQFCIMLLDDFLFGKKMDYKMMRGNKNEDTETNN